MAVYYKTSDGKRFRTLKAARAHSRRVSDKKGYGLSIETEDYTRQRKRNPSRHKKMTKAQRKARARKSSVTRRTTAALKKFLATQNPKAKFAGAQIRRNPGGSITIVPIKVRRAAR